MPADTDTVVVHSSGDAPTDWALVVRDDGVLEARRQIPYDGVLRYSSQQRTNTPQKNSEFGLAIETVVDRYLTKASVDVPKTLLVTRARQELADGVGEESGATASDRQSIEPIETDRVFVEIEAGDAPISTADEGAIEVRPRSDRLPAEATYLVAHVRFTGEDSTVELMLTEHQVTQLRDALSEAQWGDEHD